MKTVLLRSMCLFVYVLCLSVYLQYFLFTCTIICFFPRAIFHIISGQWSFSPTSCFSDVISHMHLSLRPIFCHSQFLYNFTAFCFPLPCTRPYKSRRHSPSVIRSTSKYTQVRVKSSWFPSVFYNYNISQKHSFQI